MVTLERIKELFTYSNGHLIRKIKTSDNTKTGERAGSLSKSDGYRYVYIDNNNHKEHRIIWMLNNGYIPDGFVIDHKNRNRSDNRLENLRLSTQSQNSCNSPMKINNTSGYYGVSLFDYGNRKKKWRAYITSNKKRKGLGYFEDKTEAAKAYNVAAIELHGEFAKLNEIAA